jgi:ankyrin repeat protein
MKNRYCNITIILLVNVAALGLLGGCASEGNTSLHYAAGKGYVSKVQTLLSRQAKVDALNDSGYTPLASAVHSYKMEVERTADEKKIQNYQKTIRLLVDAGADINYIKNDPGSTILYLAVCYFDSGRNEKQQIEALKFLMDMGADPNLMGQDYSPLTIAIQKPRYDMAKVLLDNGADPWKLPARFSQESGSARLNLLDWAKKIKRDELYEFLYPYMKDRYEATNKGN